MLPGVGRSSLTSVVETLAIPGLSAVRFKAWVKSLAGTLCRKFNVIH